ncbi:MAG: 2OG-Fe(II) oxygenase [Gammaproteobacteria bacterium]|nr:2OG-Fe(II) oxygenase [Gammaproteobacteria bacterium]MCP5135300.1 2OG-Fe(II) oxygenase [Gammaproteobacteria bacterium]
MNTILPVILDDTPDHTLNAGRSERFIDALADVGWCVVDDFITPIRVAELRANLLASWEEGEFRPAGVGRGEKWELKPEVRTDRVCWLDPNQATPPVRFYLELMERLRNDVNRNLFLGLVEFEAHMAVYPPGTYYRKHLDQFIGVGTRTLSAILYLNENWQPEDGGQLRIYTDETDENRYQEITPIGGRLVLFLSARFLHEVMPARRERLGVTGWFRTRDMKHV